MKTKEDRLVRRTIINLVITGYLSLVTFLTLSNKISNEATIISDGLILVAAVSNNRKAADE